MRAGIDWTLSSSMSAVKEGWQRYNEALVKRGELYLDFAVMEEWRRRPKKTIGGAYCYSESYIRFLAPIRLLLHYPYRQRGSPTPFRSS
jgi:hypothetical protein